MNEKKSNAGVRSSEDSKNPHFNSAARRSLQKTAKRGSVTTTQATSLEADGLKTKKNKIRLEQLNPSDRSTILWKMIIL